MYQYIWDPETGGLLLTTEQSKFSKEPRPVYYRELDMLGFDAYWTYPREEHAPLMWAEANNYIYRGRVVARTKGGSLYCKPEISIIEEPEPDGAPLRFVDVEAMCRKNHDLMITLVQETIQRIYNTYRAYQQKIDIFYVAFSGGKDSVVALDLVQRALPHDSFKVLFGDTQMEFPDTYKTVEEIKRWCELLQIDFISSKSELIPDKSWQLFGPPATTCRWCCSVHKTSPQIIALRKLSEKCNFTGMAIVGVRADESDSRSKYDVVTCGEKHKGQYNFNAILDWGSAEIYLHIFEHNLILNKAYTKGNRRAGCLMCPRAAERNEYFARVCYPDRVEWLTDKIRDAYSETYTGQRLEDFINNGGWKARKSGRDIKGRIRYTDDTIGNQTLLRITDAQNSWQEWIKTIGILTNDASPYRIQFMGKTFTFEVKGDANNYTVTFDSALTRTDTLFVKMMKSVFRKAAYCIGCHECEADCHNGCIEMENGSVVINDNCRHCMNCHKPENGCLIAASRKMPKGGSTMKTGSLNRYSHHAPKPEWIEEYFAMKDEFHTNHSLGTKMIQYFKVFLRDAQLLDEGKFSSFASVIERIGIHEQVSWALILINLVNSSVQIDWFVRNVRFDEEYTKKYTSQLLVEAGADEKWVDDVWASLVRFVRLPFNLVGMGHLDTHDKKNPSIIRTKWNEPVPEVILYALYKFAEACGKYYQFSLETLMDDTIERDGISPTRIFGLDRDTMIRILNGLSNRYPEFISASFVLDLDNITLQSDKTADDVLALF